MNGSKNNKTPLAAVALIVMLLLAANCSCGVLNGMGDESAAATQLSSLR